MVNALHPWGSGLAEGNVTGTAKITTELQDNGLPVNHNASRG